MHNYLINASVQILPIVQDKHPYEWVDEAIAVIQDSGIQYEIGAFSTVLEGSYPEVMAVIDAINEHLFTHQCQEWITSVQIQIRSGGDMTGDEKTAKFKQPQPLTKAIA